ncbi:flagellar hook-basal body complex protein FliE [Xylanimonas oleitrophica]|uniref:Flagellar hook-basal body complex protein FliE n=1 Tax=Xylanimonas oleitrophica TaxID=2607479 RepID=A0A2W5X1H3_9MICO|nr:flagellar hook-basal body complex protein FliE [Xylanimonas oleitrophica]PZR54125.1 flagellar hook-basal body complex protein FliE [Xylanimonas oleitrophica]
MFSPVGAVSAVTPVMPAAGLQAVDRTPAADAAGSGFAVALGGAIDQLQAAQSTSQALAVKAVTGDLDDVHDYTIAAAQASTMLELTAAVRNKAVEAFTEIMRMQA